MSLTKSYKNSIPYCLKPTKIEQALLDRMTFDECMIFYEWLIRKLEEARN